MTDRDVRNLLASLDEVVPAPPELVERVWRDVEGLLIDGVEGAPGDRGAIPEVVEIDFGRPTSSHHRGPRRRGLWLAVAAVILLVGLAVGTLDQLRRGSDEVAVSDTPPESVDSTDAPPATAEDACATFRAAIGDVTPFGDDPASDDGVAVESWVDALGALIADIDRIGLPEGADDEILTLQLLRTALRSSELGLAAGDLDSVSTALANAARHRDSLAESETLLPGCFEPTR